MNEIVDAIYNNGWLIVKGVFFICFFIWLIKIIFDWFFRD